MSVDPEGIVPDDFDLDAARNATSTTPREDMVSCPDCGSVKTAPRTDGWHRCRQCGRRFDPENPEAIANDRRRFRVEELGLLDDAALLAELTAKQAADYEAVILDGRTITQQAERRGVAPSTVFQNVEYAQMNLAEMAGDEHGTPYPDKVSSLETPSLLDTLAPKQRADYEAVVLGDRTPTEQAEHRVVDESVVWANVSIAETRLAEEKYGRKRPEEDRGELAKLPHKARLDYRAVVLEGVRREVQAERRGVRKETIQDNVRRAKRILRENEDGDADE